MTIRYGWSVCAVCIWTKGKAPAYMVGERTVLPRNVPALECARRVCCESTVKRRMQVTKAANIYVKVTSDHVTTSMYPFDGCIQRKTTRPHHISRCIAKDVSWRLLYGVSASTMAEPSGGVLDATPELSRESTLYSNL